MSGNPNWVKGVSGNPSGRTKAQSDAAKQLARMIQEKTRDGAALVEFALAVLTHNDINAATNAAVHGLAAVTARDKIDVLQWLADRGYGKALQVLDIAAEVGTLPALVLTAKSDADLEAAERVLRASGAGELGDGG